MKKKSRGQGATAWTRYWGKAPAATGCLPELPATIADHIRKIWWLFFASLPPAARLLDLGCGNGAVLLEAHARRPDLCLTGVDYASALPDLGSGIALHRETAFDSLPLADGGTDAITGQFAIEYGIAATTVPEVLRVLDQEGSYLFICHHAESPIVHDNRQRLSAIQTMLGPTGLLSSAVEATRKGKKATPETRQRLARIFATTQARFPGQSVLHEVAADIARIMTAPQSLENLFSLRRDVQLEAERISALQKAALSVNQAGALAQLLSSPKRPAHLGVVYLPETRQPFAWRLSSQPQPKENSSTSLAGEDMHQG